MYNPVLGRWMSEDPIEFDAGDPNLGRYVANNPVNLVDPNGLAALNKVIQSPTLGLPFSQCQAPNPKQPVSKVTGTITKDAPFNRYEITAKIELPAGSQIQQVKAVKGEYVKNKGTGATEFVKDKGGPGIGFELKKQPDGTYKEKTEVIIGNNPVTFEIEVTYTPGNNVGPKSTIRTSVVFPAKKP